MALKRMRERSNVVRAFFSPRNQDTELLVQAGLEALNDALKYHNPSRGAFSTLAVPIIEQRMWDVVQQRVAEAKQFRSDKHKKRFESAVPGEDLDRTHELGDRRGADWFRWQRQNTPHSLGKNDGAWTAGAAKAFHAAESDDEFAMRHESAEVADPNSTRARERELEQRHKWEERRARLLDRIDRLLPHLSDLERQAVSLHYGLVDGQSRSWAEIGKALKVGEERVRQLLASGLKKLRDLAG